MSKRPIPLTAFQAARTAKAARIKSLSDFDPLSTLNDLIEENVKKGLNSATIVGGGVWTDEAKEIIDGAARALKRRGFDIAIGSADFVVTW